MPTDSVHDAVTRRSLEDTRVCLASGADVNTPDKSGQTPLHVAATSGFAEAIPLLVTAGAELAARDAYGQTPLHAAAAHGNSPEVVTALLQAGAELAATVEDARVGQLRALQAGTLRGREPLHMAACHSTTPAVLAVLLEAGAEVDARDAFAYTPLHCAAGDNPNVEVTEFLLKSGADVHALNSAEATPLHFAAKTGEAPAVVMALLQASAELEAREEYGQTPLHWAAQGSRSPEVLKALLEAGADIKAQDDDGETPLDIAARASLAILGPAPEVVAMLRQWDEKPPFSLSQAQAQTRRAVQALARHRAELPFSEAEFALSFAAYVEWIKRAMVEQDSGHSSMFDAPNDSARFCAIEFVAMLADDAGAHSEIVDLFPDFIVALEQNWARSREYNDVWHVSLTRALIIGCRSLAYAHTGFTTGGPRLSIPPRVTIGSLADLSRDWLTAEIGPSTAARAYRAHWSEV